MERSIYRATAMAATARRPAATEQTFLVAAPLKLDADGLALEPEPEPVLGFTTGAIGEPVAAEPEPGAPAPDPVAAGVVPVGNPVDPAAVCKVWTLVLVQEHSVS